MGTLPYMVAARRAARGGGDRRADADSIREGRVAVDIVLDSIKFLDTFEAQAHGAPKGTFVRAAYYSASFEGESIASSETSEIDFSRTV